MFFQRNKKNIEIFSPLKGQLIPLAEVPDPTFAEEILGKGIAIKPEDGNVYAPADGKIEVMFDTGHAVSLISDKGAEILIHVGLDTVTLKGKYFKSHCKSGDIVKKGQLLISFEKENIEAEGFKVITPVIITNTLDYKTFTVSESENVNENDLLISLVKK